MVRFVQPIRYIGPAAPSPASSKAPQESHPDEIARAELRRAIYLPALSAARCNPDLKALYDRLRAKGKPFKLALAAVMRKLLLLANSLVRDDRQWTHAKPT